MLRGFRLSCRISNRCENNAQPTIPEAFPSSYTQSVCCVREAPRGGRRQRTGWEEHMSVGKKRILISCGSGAVTSMVARKKVEALLIAHGYEGRYEIDQVPLSEAVEESRNYDFIVATAISPNEVHCPFVNGVTYLMGVGTETSDAEILRLMEA